jgi:hypothetical protein
MAWTGQGEPIRARDWEVRGVDIAIAQRLVILHHYARGTSNTKTHLHGLFPAGALFDEECVGAAWWIPPTKAAAKALAGDRWQGVLALSRLVIAPHVGGCAATFLMGRSIRLIDRARWPYLVTYADEWRGHGGGIYRGTGWVDEGLTSPEAVYTIDGRMTARKAGGKTRTHAEMMALGATFEGRFAKRRFTMRPHDDIAR